MRFRLRTLLIVLALGPVVLAGAWRAYCAWRMPNLNVYRNLQDLENREWPEGLRIPATLNRP
jgi:hypothetical protein